MSRESIKANQLRYRAAHPERVFEQSRLRAARYRAAHLEELLEKARAYERAHPNRPHGDPETHPEKSRARVAVNAAVRLGRLIRRPCAVCGEPKVQAHHYLGYARERRFDVVWLCALHHKRAHTLLRKQAAA